MMTQEQFLEVANGDENAAAFLAAFQDKAHLLDDDVDHEARGDIDRAMVEMNWMLTLAGNPFVRAHSEKLLPVMTLGLNAWLDANVWRQSVKRRDRLAADVVKGYYHEVVYLVALICGGFNHMRAMSARHRGYDIEEDI